MPYGDGVVRPECCPRPLFFTHKNFIVKEKVSVMPSPIATRLAEDIRLIGELLGFQASVEEPIEKGSRLQIDAFWKIKMPEGAPVPEFNIASFEIQYSNSIPSISHNLGKAEVTKHPAIHFVISYNSLSEDYESVIKKQYPAGIKIFQGEQEFMQFQKWLMKYRYLSDVREGLVKQSEIFNKGFIETSLGLSEEEFEKNVMPDVMKYYSNLLVPKYVTTFLDDFYNINPAEYDRSIFD
ncbi:MAG: hypothetical protein NWF07_00975, partial [Candidatus Bathyarchaeota archaeon]|nr:hypothetical protein [Candidatus Bathyarchaeota archaeon]